MVRTDGGRIILGQRNPFGAFHPVEVGDVCAVGAQNLLVTVDFSCHYSSAYRPKAGSGRRKSRRILSLDGPGEAPFDD
jgi:hypothetical protein